MPDSILEIKGKSGKIYQFRIPEGTDDAGFQRIQQTAERVMISNGENAFSPLGPPAPAHLPSQAPASPPAATPKTVRKEGLGYMPVGDALKQSIYGKPPPRTAPSLEKARIQPPPKLPTLREQLAQAVEAAKKHQRIADEMAKRNRPTIGPATPQMMQQPRYSGEELDKQMLAAMSYEQLQAEYDRRRAAHEANPKNTQQFEDFRTAQEALAEKSPGSLIKPAYLLQDILTTAKSALTREEEEGIGRLAAVAQTAFNIGMLDEPVAKVGSKYVGGVISKMATKGPLAPIVKAMKAFAARGDWSAIGREISRMNPGEFEAFQGAFRDAMPKVQFRATTGKGVLSTAERAAAEAATPKGEPLQGKTRFPALEDIYRNAQERGGADRKLVIMRGLPGSGKSTLAREIAGGQGTILSTDEFWGKDYAKNFDVGKLKEAHEWNQTRADKAMEQGNPLVVIDNVNARNEHMQPYIESAQKHGYSIEYREPNTPWARDPAELAKRNTHNVNEKTIQKMLDQWEPVGESAADAVERIMRQAGTYSDGQIKAGRMLAGMIYGDARGPGGAAVEQASEGGLRQVEDILSGAKATPDFSKEKKPLTAAAKWIQQHARENPVFKRPIKDLSSQTIEQGLYEHTSRELDAWEKLGKQYTSFYKGDIVDRANPKLRKWAKSRYGRDLTDSEVQLYHLVSAFASPNATPKFDSAVGLKVFDRFLRDGVLSAEGDTTKTIWKTTKKGRVDTGVAAIDPATGLPRKAKVSRTYLDVALARTKALIENTGSLDNAIKFLETKHSYDEIVKTLGLKRNQLGVHEYLTKDGESYGIFGLGNMPKIGSYILNRWQKFETITKDLWVGRTMARMTSPKTLVRGGKVLGTPWKTTAEELRFRKALDAAWGRVAKERGMTPAGVQEAMWDLEQGLYGKLGAAQEASNVSEGLKEGTRNIRLETIQRWYRQTSDRLRSGADQKGASQRVGAAVGRKGFTHDSGGGRLGSAPIARTHTPSPEFAKDLRANGLAVRPIHELKPGGESAGEFARLINEAKASNEYGPAVHAYEPEEYAGMRLFVMDGGKSGFALKDGDIVSVFRHEGGEGGSSYSLLKLATEQGGNRLDAFDTVLPGLYAESGFRVTSRIPWDETQRPDGWSKTVFAEFNNGEPDVVFMIHDPAAMKDYKPGAGRLFTGPNNYDKAQRAQMKALEKLQGATAPVPRSATDTPQFKAWFGKSKVVDARGKPLIVYHGTGADFTAFRRRKGDIGIHFGTAGQADDRMRFLGSRKAASEGGERVIPVYLSIQKPLRMEDLGAWDIENLQYGLKAVFPDEEARIMGLRSESDARAFLQGKGYDGIVYRNTGEVPQAADAYAAWEDAMRAAVADQKARGRPTNAFTLEDQQRPAYQKMRAARQEYDALVQQNATDSYIVFDPSQAKSALANSGAYDKRSSDLLKQTQAGVVKGTYRPSDRFVELVKGNADFSTVIHELAHDWHGWLADHPVHGDLIRRFYGTLEDKRGAELFARHLEHYFRTGKAPVAKLQAAFDAIASWMREIYARWRYGKPPEEIQTFFDKWFSKPSDEVLAIAKDFEDSAQILKEARAAVADAKGAGNKPPIDQREVAPRYHQERVTTDDTLAEDLAASLEAEKAKKEASAAPETGSGVSRATRAQMVEVLGTRGPTSISGQTLEELYKQGQKDVVTGQPEALIAELAQKGQPASDKQIGLFAAFRDHLVEHLRGLNEALANPISDAAHAASLVEREDLLARIAEFDRHLDEVKAANGRGLGAIRIGQTVNWGDLGEATIEARRFAGTSFKPGVEKELADATARVQRLEEALKQAQSAAETARAEEGFARAASGPRRGARTASAARADRKASGERIKELIRKSTNVGPSAGGGALQGLLENAPELAREIRRYIELAIEEFKLTRLDQQFYDTVRRELGSLSLKDADGNAIDFSDADIRQIFAKHYEQTTRTPREAAQNLSNLRKQADLFEKIEQAKAGVVPERGPRPPAASEEVKALRSQLNQLLKTMSADPGADAARTRLQGILADVDAMLKGQYRKVKAPKGEVAPDIAALKQRIADVRTQMRLQDRLSDLEEQIRTGQLRPPTKRERQLSDAAARIQSQVDSAKQRVRAIAEAQRPQSVVSKVEGFGRNMQLLNQMARVIDATANTVKLASYIATNPVRSTASALMFGKTTGRETFLLMPEKVGRIMKGAPERWGREIAEVWRGADLDTLNKFGKTGGLGTKLAGVTDVVFKDFYTRAAMDDYALGFGREAGLRGQALKDYRLAAWKQLTTGGAGPLSDAQVRVAAAGAEDWALRQTFNIENVLSEGVAGAKQNVRRFLTKRGKPDAADGLAAVIDMTTRFTKVITNVALEKANYTNGLGAVEALIRLGNAKRAGGGIIKGKVATQDARLIVDLATKGLTGLAVYKAGTTLHDGGFFDDLKERGILSMEVMQTEGGTRFVQWRIAPDLLGGGLDADQLGGVLTPLLMGATKKELERQVKRNQLTEKQAESLFTKYRLEQAASTPLASGMKDAIRVAEGEKTIQQFIASYVSRQLVPGGVRDIAERMDEARTGVQLRKSKEPQDEFIKRIPIWRESLPSNMKGAKAGATNAPPMPDWMKGR